MADSITSNKYLSGGGNFFLVGFMGSGKTHWGKKWAPASQLSFVDLDELIEKKAEKTITTIFETLGEDHFREIEARTLRDCASLQNTIVACGGGTPCFFENMKWMNEHGTTIYIASTPAEIVRRVLSEKARRPLLKKLNESELLFYIKQKLSERSPYYLQSHWMVQASQLTESSFEEIISIIKP